MFLAGLRSVLATLFVWGWLAWNGRPPRLPRAMWATGALMGGIFALEFLCLFLALDLTSVSRASIIFYSMPVWLALMAHLGLAGERISTVQGLGLVAAFAGDRDRDPERGRRGAGGARQPRGRSARPRGGGVLGRDRLSCAQAGARGGRARDAALLDGPRVGPLAARGLARLRAARARPDSLQDLAAKLSSPRIFWVMLPAGKPTEDTIAELAELAEPADIIIDGGNTFYKDDIRRAKTCAEGRFHYVDVGTSGGVWGLERGYCMMIGGEKAIVELLDPIFDTLAPGYGTIARTEGRDQADDRAERGYIHAGPAGAGHFVKMVHNGIEYGLMQAYAEGFDILKGKMSDKLGEDERFDIDLPDVAEVWRRGSVISSWLLDLSAAALARDADLRDYSGSVSDSGEGRWTIEAAMEEAVPANVLSAALFARFRSRVDSTFGDKLLSAMRFGFGGHVEMPQ